MIKGQKVKLIKEFRGLEIGHVLTVIQPLSWGKWDGNEYLVKDEYFAYAIPKEYLELMEE